MRWSTHVHSIVVPAAGGLPLYMRKKSGRASGLTCGVAVAGVADWCVRVRSGRVGVGRGVGWVSQKPFVFDLVSPVGNERAVDFFVSNWSPAQFLAAKQHFPILPQKEFKFVYHSSPRPIHSYGAAPRLRRIDLHK